MAPSTQRHAHNPDSSVRLPAPAPGADSAMAALEAQLKAKLGVTKLNEGDSSGIKVTDSADPRFGKVVSFTTEGPPSFFLKYHDRTTTSTVGDNYKHYYHMGVSRENPTFHQWGDTYDAKIEPIGNGKFQVTLQLRNGFNGAVDFEIGGKNYFVLTHGQTQEQKLGIAARAELNNTFSKLKELNKELSDPAISPDAKKAILDWAVGADHKSGAIGEINRLMKDKKFSEATAKMKEFRSEADKKLAEARVPKELPLGEIRLEGDQIVIPEPTPSVPLAKPVAPTVPSAQATEPVVPPVVTPTVPPVITPEVPTAKPAAATAEPVVAPADPTVSVAAPVTPLTDKLNKLSNPQVSLEDRAVILENALTEKDKELRAAALAEVAKITDVLKQDELIGAAHQLYLSKHQGAAQIDTWLFSKDPAQTKDQSPLATWYKRHEQTSEFYSKIDGATVNSALHSFIAEKTSTELKEIATLFDRHYAASYFDYDEDKILRDDEKLTGSTAADFHDLYNPELMIELLRASKDHRAFMAAAIHEIHNRGNGYIFGGETIDMISIFTDRSLLAPKEATKK